MSEKPADTDFYFSDLEGYMKEQVKEALSSVNKNVASKKLGREPTDEEAIKHWLAHKGPENFAEQHRSKFLKKK